MSHLEFLLMDLIVITAATCTSLYCYVMLLCHAKIVLCQLYGAGFIPFFIKFILGKTQTSNSPLWPQYQILSIYGQFAKLLTDGGQITLYPYLALCRSTTHPVS